MICLAGAAAEEQIYGNRSTGARNDYEQAYRYVRTLIETGLSDLGIIDPELMDKEKLQTEMSKQLQHLFKRTSELLFQYRSLFMECLYMLLQEETLSGEEFRKRMHHFVA
ncbi:hypothetical protein [Thermoflavimicrobium daqui]|uniref:Peptidase M41 domain-containing protein n=1 Tax=Thermoflavimicrobium daqui TaxID=2137476 RepID=A0A364K0L8_9BACL|nr:hypothetical protein [Thermoflavimicrobium daqui]RAL20808.1 hypothetical protein DL897_17855 [Thermoflavimicrobium daqui]